jgi:predicted GNAT family acetyltransferase
MTTDQKQEDEIDEALEETFPASDPPANTVETGAVIGPVPTESQPAVSDNIARHRFELEVDGEIAFLAYERAHNTLTLVHTEVPPPLRGRGLGERLVDAALEAGHTAGERIVVVCPFARTYLRKRRQSVKKVQ